MTAATKVMHPGVRRFGPFHLPPAHDEQEPADEKPLVGTDRENRYEVWAGTRSYANIVGYANTLVGALALYVRARRAKRGRTVTVLANDPSPDGGM
jgi:hypothetical protein